LFSFARRNDYAGIRVEILRPQSERDGGEREREKERERGDYAGQMYHERISGYVLQYFPLPDRRNNMIEPYAKIQGQREIAGIEEIENNN